MKIMLLCGNLGYGSKHSPYAIPMVRFSLNSPCKSRITRISRIVNWRLATLAIIESYKHSAPMGLGCGVVVCFYKHSAPMGLRLRAFESIFYKLDLCEEL